MRLLLAAALLTATLVSAQAPKPALPKDHGHLVFSLVLSRHGIRPPLHPTSELNLRSSDPWPEWEVPLGYLTPHGELALQAMGAYMRQDYTRTGLLPATGCPAPGSLYLYADTDERNIASTRATFRAFAPGCPPLPVNVVATLPDAMLSDKYFGTPPPPEKTTTSQPSNPHPVPLDPELTEFAHILAPDPAHPAAKPVLSEPNPLAASSSLLEDILLEYYDDKPLSEVGWGRVDAATLHRLVLLHAPAFGQDLRDPYRASFRASNVILHILDTLQQAATAAPVPGAIGPVGTRLVYLSGHDTNLYAVAAALGLRWTFDGATNGTPPDSQLVFELWQHPGSKNTYLRIRAVQQTPDQLRSAAPLTAQNPPVQQYLKPTGCTSIQHCPLSTFATAVQPILNPAATLPALQPTKPAP
jgi:4-phytase/acid phosphatase